jgi:hypothetical protein
MKFPFFQREDQPVMVVPFIADSDAWIKQESVKAMCRKAAEQLSKYLFVWRKPFPSKDTIKSWCSIEKRFQGMDLGDFQDFVLDHYSVRTADHQQWLLDSKIASLIWAECIAADSPLPVASWAIEAQRRAV